MNSIGIFCSLDFADITRIEVNLGNYYSDTNTNWSILLIDTSLVADAYLNVTNLEGIFLWEDSKDTASGWFLDFVTNEGLYASYNPIPEPSGITCSLLALGMILARSRKR